MRFQPPTWLLVGPSSFADRLRRALHRRLVAPVSTTIRTERLRLVPATLELAAADLQGRTALARILDAEVRIYHHLFEEHDPEEVGDFLEAVNPDSLEVRTGCKLEPNLAGAEPGERYQFERSGYYCVDPDSTPERPVFNRTVPLRDTWAKIRKRQRSG